MKQVTAETISQMSDAEVLKLLGDMRDIPISSKRRVWKSLNTGIYDSSGKLIGDRAADEDDYLE